jgi:hypothetical protein
MQRLDQHTNQSLRGEKHVSFLLEGKDADIAVSASVTLRSSDAQENQRDEQGGAKKEENADGSEAPPLPKLGATSTEEKKSPPRSDFTASVFDGTKGYEGEGPVSFTKGSSSGTIERQGWMWMKGGRKRRGQIRRGWKKRWFILQVLILDFTSISVLTVACKAVCTSGTLPLIAR